MEQEPDWRALDAALRAITHLAAALTPGNQGPDRVERLFDAKREFEQAIELVEVALIHAEGESAGGDGHD